MSHKLKINLRKKHLYCNSSQHKFFYEVVILPPPHFNSKLCLTLVYVSFCSKTPQLQCCNFAACQWKKKIIYNYVISVSFLFCCFIPASKQEIRSFGEQYHQSHNPPKPCCCSYSYGILSLLCSGSNLQTLY